MDILLKNFFKEPLNNSISPVPIRCISHYLHLVTSISPGLTLRSKSIFLLESPHAAASKILCTGICTLFRAHWQFDVISVLLSPRLWSLRISWWFSISSSLNPISLHLGLSPLSGVQKWCPRGQVVILWGRFNHIFLEIWKHDSYVFAAVLQSSRVRFTREAITGHMSSGEHIISQCISIT